YTLNRFKAAPLIVTEETIYMNQSLQAIVVNSANANSCTGARGLQDAKDTQAWAAEQLNIEPYKIGVASTGVIGSFLPMEKIQYGTQHILNEKYNQSQFFNQSILTTDTTTKHLSVQVEIDGKTVTIGGTAKGSGMVHPNMATMLGFITTDANVDARTLDNCLKQATDQSFNMITVDGDTSTNDMVLCMANGQVDHQSLDENHPEWHKFIYAFNFVSQYLAKSIAKDGEGATKLVTAIGYAAKHVEPSEINVSLCQLPVLEHGMHLPFDEQLLKARLTEDNIVIEVSVGDGDGEAAAYGCDLSYEYVRINASYRT